MDRALVGGATRKRIIKIIDLEITPAPSARCRRLIEQKNKNNHANLLFDRDPFVRYPFAARPLLRPIPRGHWTYLYRTRAISTDGTAAPILRDRSRGYVTAVTDGMMRKKCK